MAKDEKTAEDYTEYPGKPATELQRNMAEWLQGDTVGADPSACKNKQEAFELGVKLGVSLRIQFQQSDFNQELRAKAAEEREARAAEKAESKKSGKAAKAKAKAADEDEADEDEAEEEAPKPTKKAASKKAAAKKPAKKAASKKAAPADEDDEDDEF